MKLWQRARWLPLAHWLLVALLWAMSPSVWALSITKTPSSSSDCTSPASGAGTASWSSRSLSRAWSSDNKYATVGLSASKLTSKYLQCLNYGFSIPASATINGITVNVDDKFSAGRGGAGSSYTQDAYMRIVKGGTIGTIDRSLATEHTTTEVSAVHGSSTDLWGQTWTAADINSATFGAAYAATLVGSNALTFSLDVISITVDYTLDTTPPTVTSIVRANPNPTAASSVTWTVTFSESVTGVNTGDFVLVNSGVAGSPAITTVSGSGTTWTVNASTGSTTATGTLTMTLVDNDSIVDASSNKLGGTGFVTTGNGSKTGETYNVDKSSPTVVSIVRASTNPTIAASVSWTVTFSESVTGVDATDFALAATGSVTAGTPSVSGSGATRTVTIATLTGTGTLGLNLVDNDSIVDSNSQKLAGTGTTGTANGSWAGEVYTVDRDAPSVLSITRDDPNPTSLNELTWTVTFSESVTGVNVADFALATSGLAGATITGITGSGTTWVVSADPGYGAGTMGLNLVDDDSIADVLTNKLGGTGAANGNYTGEVYTVTTPAMASYLMEQTSWNGTTDQVIDEQSANPGTAKNSATTASVTQALTGNPGTCRYGTFYSASAPTIAKGYIDLTNAFPYLSADLTITGWIRTTNNSTSNQWIFKHSSASGTGYSLSLGTAGAGRLRFASNGAATINLDSPSSAASLLAANTWYFVAAVADFSGDPNIVRKIYVYNSSGTLLSGYPVSLTSTGWDDTEAGAATLGGDGTNSVLGNLDEMQIFDKALNQAALTSLAQARHACTTNVPDHYELSMATSSISCLPTTVTVTACADSSSPCTNTYTGATGSTATLATSAGTLLASSLTFDASGVVSTTLSHPAAVDGTAVSVTLSNESLAATNSRQCCPNGASCTAASSCSSTFNTAGLIYSSSANGTQVSSFPAQVAGTSSGTYYVRAVKTGTTTKACEAALTGSATVNWGLVCVNPATCSAGNLMSVTGNGSATAIAGNPFGQATSFTGVPVTFDANGNAPFSFTYNDAGRIRLDSKMTVNSATLSGVQNTTSHVTAPARFAVTNIKQTASPNLVNPGAASAAGSRFVKAGESFTATVTAQTTGGATTPNFGKESTPEGVLLTPTLVLPSGGTSGSLSNGTIAGGSFSNGVATVTNLAYSEVGIVTLTSTVASGNYINTGGAVAATTTGNIGRFYPAQFALSGGTVTHRSGSSCSPASAFTYLGENFLLGLTLTAQNTAGSTTANYSGAFAKLDPTSAGDWNVAGLGGTTTFSTASGRLSLGTASGSWTNGVASNVGITANATRASAADGPFSATFGVVPTDSDGVTMSTLNMASTSGGTADRTSVSLVALRFGRLRLGNAVGGQSRALSLPLTAQYWNGTAFDTNTLDSCTAIAPTHVSFGNLRKTLTTADTSVSGTSFPLSSGVGALKIGAPLGGRYGTMDIALSLGSSATDASCLQSWTPGSGDVATAGANLSFLRGAWCGSTYDKDPSARASFGLYRGADAMVYQRENY
ncbi:MAG: hypothetical protein B7Y51_05930 [Burkholderiales bacterium 28-67-8]|nr:MAG: hypothetical protein B7Y51_05930 [Burkholderiales bacterium 28-67-8]